MIYTVSPKEWSPSRHIIVGCLALAVLLGGFGSWATMVQLSGAVIASGQVQVEHNRFTIQHPVGGSVIELFVEEGEVVTDGQPLLTLDTAELEAELEVVSDQLVEVQARRSLLEAERIQADQISFPQSLVLEATSSPTVADILDRQRELFSATRETVRKQTELASKQINQIREQINGINAQLLATDRQLALLVVDLEDQRALLEKGFSQATRVRDIEREEARLQGIRGELLARRGQGEAAITEIETELVRADAQRREEASSQLREVASNEQTLTTRQRSLREKISKQTITSPTSGHVLSLQPISQGAVVQAGAPIMYIVPNNQPLIVSVQVPPLNVDEVNVGQSVRLVFPAFQGQNPVERFGEVTMISADAFTDQTRGTAFYRADVTLTGTQDTGTSLPLIPGMPVEAFIQTAPRTPWDYLTMPVQKYFERAMKDG